VSPRLGPSVGGLSPIVTTPSSADQNGATTDADEGDQRRDDAEEGAEGELRDLTAPGVEDDRKARRRRIERLV